MLPFNNCDLVVNDSGYCILEFFPCMLTRPILAELEFFKYDVLNLHKLVSDLSMMNWFIYVFKYD